MRSRLRLVALLAAGSSCAPAPRYERSPQWRDGRFHNPPEWPPLPPTVADFLRWRMGRRPEPSTYRVPSVPNDGARLRQNRSAVSVTWIGHATTLIQAGGMAFLTDPIFSDWLGFFERLVPPGVALAHLPKIDVVVISHNHYDHLDEATVRALGPSVQYVVPLGLADWFRRRGLAQVIELDWWQSIQIGGARVTMVPAQHWSRRGVTDENRSLWGGYLIDAGARRFYFAGDSGYPAAFTEIGRRFAPIDYALLPIGAYAPRWFMHAQHIAPEEAARAFHEVGAKRLVPMHYGTFPLADDPPDEPLRLLREAMGRDRSAIVELSIGATWWE